MPNDKLKDPREPILTEPKKDTTPYEEEPGKETTPYEVAISNKEKEFQNKTKKELTHELAILSLDLASAIEQINTNHKVNIQLNTELNKEITKTMDASNRVHNLTRTITEFLTTSANISTMLKKSISMDLSEEVPTVKSNQN